MQVMEKQMIWQLQDRETYDAVAALQDRRLVNGQAAASSSGAGSGQQGKREKREKRAGARRNQKGEQTALKVRAPRKPHSLAPSLL